MSSINVAIAGGTGNLGVPVTRAFLSSTVRPSQVNRVVVLTRDASSAKAKELQSLGAEIYDGTVDAKALQGIDVVVNTYSHYLPGEVSENLAKAAADAGAKVYFPNEYGMDLRSLGKYGKPYEGKTIRADFARQLNNGALKVVSLYVGAFLEILFRYPMALGIDLPNRVFTVVGDPAAKFSSSSIINIASSIVRLAILAVQDPSSVPDHARLNGTAFSMAELAELVGKEQGSQIQVNFGDLEAVKAKIENEDDKIALALYAMGTGTMDYSNDNVNELVNPDESLWKWVSIDGEVKRTKGLTSF
ncbi:hypothetical protein M407DRAFT_4953 [Tulasnella calospora MUT 4182]|uniref:NmrA-like domain-containing protein n=1 Tax=Tulasnella calospora MUT 4182 TaxID=1051891 RepID=A0A0C3MD04_9AGAM|nr:hypothetical protein M407DRAFT_4953 [Tulasnella calospora MUT 4182]